MEDTKRPHVAVLVSPGMGHLIPALELTKRLISHHHFTATVFLATPETNSASSSTESDLLHPSTLPPSHLLQITPLPAAAAQLHGPSATVVGRLCSMMRSILPHLRSALSQTPSPPTTLIVDLFGTEALTIAESFGMRKYVLCTSNAWFLTQALYMPTLDKEISPGEDLKIPGCRPIRYEDIPHVVLEWGTPDYDECVRVGSEMATADGILVNTWDELDPISINALRTNGIFNKTPVHQIGPLTRLSEPDTKEIRNEVFAWLDEQPSESVVYVSFGSGGTLSRQQTTELAYGLELSHQRFVWVIRPPHDEAFDQVNVSRFVPGGFMERTRDVGKTVWMWAHQTEILAHPAVGGFLSHCGWNSSLESLTNGIPLIAWPFYAEQNMNAALLCDVVKVAVRAAALPAKVVVGREEVGEMVWKIMVDEEGRQYRERAKELQWSAQQALSHVNRGGSSSGPGL